MNKIRLHNNQVVRLLQKHQQSILQVQNDNPILITLALQSDKIYRKSLCHILHDSLFVIS
jgi:hypothetical protein